MVTAVWVNGGPDVADQHIVAEARSGDLVVTQDIPLAALLVPKGIVVLDPRGEEHTAETIGERLSIRDLMEQARMVGMVTGGPPPFDARAKQAFAGALDRTLTRLQRAPRTVLFLCTGNSCRSILAEATFNHLAPAGWRAISAGSHPTGTVHPRALALLARESISSIGCASKSWDELPHTPSVVITVCASAAGESCPAYLTPAVRAHWGVDDPAQATGTDADIDAAFERAYRTLRARIEAFLTLPLQSVTQDRARFTRALEEIADVGS
jgi:arsenate reductase (thioredoxin)